MQEVQTWERISTETVVDCRVFDVSRHRCRRSGDGKIAEFYEIDSPDWVNVVAITRDDEIVMIEQFRHGTEELRVELPGGIVDDDESPEDAAKRELLEETGYSSGHWELIGTSRPNPALQGNTIYHFLANGCEKNDEQSLDPNESIVNRLVGAGEVAKMVAAGEITHSLVLAAFYFLAANRKLSI